MPTARVTDTGTALGWPAARADAENGGAVPLAQSSPVDTWGAQPLPAPALQSTSMQCFPMLDINFRPAGFQHC